MGNRGSVFEGVTQYVSELICSEVDQGFSVVSGQIAIGDFVIPGQVDRMIVHGEGREIGVRSGIYQYDISQVIAIFESKKTLNRSSLLEAINQLGQIRQYGFYLKDYYTKNGLPLDVQEYSKFIFGNGVKKDTEFNILKLNESFLIEKYLPISIVYGHNGFNRLSTFASAYHDIVFGHKSNFGSHWNLPTLTISGNDVITKGGLYPFFHYNDVDRCIIHAVVENWAFEALVSSLWKKINIDGVLKFPFEYADLKQNARSPVVGFKYRPVEGQSGWHDPMSIALSYKSSFKSLTR